MLPEVIYALKREFSFQLTFISNTEMVRDFGSGKAEISSTEYLIDRAIVLPKQIRLFGTNQLAENERTVLLDLSDVWFEITADFKVEFEDTVWDISSLVNHSGNILELVIKHV